MHSIMSILNFMMVAEMWSFLHSVPAIKSNKYGIVGCVHREIVTCMFRLYWYEFPMKRWIRIEPSLMRVFVYESLFSIEFKMILNIQSQTPFKLLFNRKFWHFYSFSIRFTRKLLFEELVSSKLQKFSFTILINGKRFTLNSHIELYVYFVDWSLMGQLNHLECDQRCMHWLEQPVFLLSR